MRWFKLAHEDPQMLTKEKKTLRQKILIAFENLEIHQMTCTVFGEKDFNNLADSQKVLRR